MIRDPECIKNPIDIFCHVCGFSGKAIKVNDGGREDTWLPTSQVYFDEETIVGDSINITMPEWLAKERGFI